MIYPDIRSCAEVQDIDEFCPERLFLHWKLGEHTIILLGPRDSHDGFSTAEF